MAGWMNGRIAMNGVLVWGARIGLDHLLLHLSALFLVSLRCLDWIFVHAFGWTGSWAWRLDTVGSVYASDWLVVHKHKPVF